MRKSMKRCCFVLAAVMLLAILAGCQAPASETASTASTPVSSAVLSSSASEASVPLAAVSQDRIVCMTPSMVEVCYALGLGDNIVGWSQYTDYPAEVMSREGWVPYGDYEFVSIEDELTKDVAVVSSFSEYNKELVAALEPTLILVESNMQLTMYEELVAEGFNALFFNPTSVNEVFDMMIKVGQAAGVGEVATGLVDRYKADIEAIQTVTEGLPKVRVYLEIGHRITYEDGAYGPYATGHGSPFDQMVEIAGGVNVFDALEGDYVEVTNADIVAANPDVILSPMWPNAQEGEVTTIYEIVTREGFEDISAVQTSRVHFYDSSLFKRFGPRTIIAIKKLAYLLHPYYFENPEDSVSPWELGKIDAQYPVPDEFIESEYEFAA